MSTVTTHILDTALGKPASGVAISLEQNSPEGWFPISQGETDSDGRLKDLTPEPLTPALASARASAPPVPLAPASELAPAAAGPPPDCSSEAPVGLAARLAALSSSVDAW